MDDTFKRHQVIAKAGKQSFHFRLIAKVSAGDDGFTSTFADLVKESLRGFVGSAA